MTQATKGPDIAARPSGPQGEHLEGVSDASIGSLITDMHHRGYTPLQIADHVPVSRAAVYYHLKLRRLTPHRVLKPELSSRQVTQVLKAFDLGEPIAGIARRYGVEYDKVRYVVKKHRSKL